MFNNFQYWWLVRFIMFRHHCNPLISVVICCDPLCVGVGGWWWVLSFCWYLLPYFWSSNQRKVSCRRSRSLAGFPRVTHVFVAHCVDCVPRASWCSSSWTVRIFFSKDSYNFWMLSAFWWYLLICMACTTLQSNANQRSNWKPMTRCFFLIAGDSSIL